ncbi:hypothetical protein Q0590_28245 [Rhodocytophaga aerolata]|uniref:Uncharacterized protein n=1 Tax=Rhodocytophaga aerolata TaxID=455078 RepID=A0ABT8RFT9_9BACT|nr:hypothetical protein [Rhodocytophaga aerolata]MDO1450204.1 hypothetical protein [Rhodocytophaga aerolata]
MTLVGKKHKLLAYFKSNTNYFCWKNYCGSNAKNSHIEITLDRLSVATYPGSGIHTILFDFFAQNQIPEGAEDVHFNSTFQIKEGAKAGIEGYPIFLGLGVGSVRGAFQCYSVNLKNEQYEKFLSVLESTVFKKGCS